MKIQAGQTPIALRQRSAAAFSGENPEKYGIPSIIFEPFYVIDIATYVDPDVQTDSALSQGGLYDFGEQHVRVLSIHALTASGNISVIVTDRQDIQTMDLTVGGSTPAIDLGALGVVPGDIVSVGYPMTETYTVTAVNTATQLETAEIVTSKNLVVGDVFSITSANGSTIRYTHTLAGVDTLDAEVITIHDVPVGTPTASRLVFDTPLIVLASQVLKVTTASAQATGWLDVYVVKGDWF